MKNTTDQNAEPNHTSLDTPQNDTTQHEHQFALDVSLTLKIPITFIETIYPGPADTYHVLSKVAIGIGMNPNKAKEVLLEECGDERTNMIFPRTGQALPEMADLIRGCELEIGKVELVRSPNADSPKDKAIRALRFVGPGAQPRFSL